MYSGEAISALTQRIGWSKALDSEFTIELSDINLTSDSGKNFQSYHPLVSIDNIYASVPEVNMSEADFNDVLEQIRSQATLQAITEIMDMNDAYNVDTDYSDIMIANAGLFDDAIGNKVAISVLEMLLSTKRINPEERNAKLSASNLKLELEGFMNDNGFTIAKGRRYYYENAVRKATKKMFPRMIFVQSMT